MAQRNSYVNVVSTSGVLLTAGKLIQGVGILSGMYISSISTGTVLTFYDYLGATQTILMYAITSPAQGYHYLGDVECSTGCYVGVAGTANITFFVKKAD